MLCNCVFAAVFLFLVSSLLGTPRDSNRVLALQEVAKCLMWKGEHFVGIARSELVTSARDVQSTWAAALDTNKHLCLKGGDVILWVVGADVGRYDGFTEALGDSYILDFRWEWMESP